MNTQTFQVSGKMDSLEYRDKMNFIRKVYSILAVQLTITAAFIFLVQSNDDIRFFMHKNVMLYVFASIMAMVLCCMIVCCFGRQSPINYILLLGFTVCESYAIAGITAFY